MTSTLQKMTSASTCEVKTSQLFHVLKRIDFHQASKQEQRAAHLEAKLLSTIKHPNIVTYLDSFLNSFGSLFIVTNYCESGDLHTFIRNQNGVHFEEKQIVHWFVQICLALKYLHDKNILHRNLKTRNIFLTQNKIIKVGDLGLSKVLSVVHEMTATMIETPYYISPEIFSGCPFTEKSDIWALGCCTYEMATLKHPFVAPDVHSLLQKIAKRQLPCIPEVYSSELYDIISSMLDNDSEDRPCVTQLLLSDYIRRYILLILQGDSKSPDSQVTENANELLIERSKSISDLSLISPGVESINVQRSLSTCFLPKHRGKTYKMSGTAANRKTIEAKSIIISVPDVNGNGDGNDNSQHRRPAIISSCRKKDGGDNGMVSRNDDKILLKIESYTKNSSTPVSSALSSSSATSSLCSLRQCGILSTSRRRMKSEISLQILNNLSHSLQNARLDSSNDKDNYSNTNSYSTYELPHANAQSFKVPEDSSAAQVCSLPAKRTGKSVQQIEKALTREKSQSKVCSLPKIKHETILSKKISKPTKNFPHAKSQHCKADRSVGRKASAGDKISCT